MSASAYLGDGVYACTDDFGAIVLTTGDHDLRKAGNVIVLEREVIAALDAWRVEQTREGQVK